MSIKNSKFEDTDIANEAKRYNTLEQFYEYSEFLNGRLIFNMDKVDRRLNEKGSMLKTSGKLTLSTLKKADHRSGYVARFYNGASEKSLDDQITFEKQPNRVELIDLKEDTLKEIPIKGNSVKLNGIAHAKIISIYFEY